MGWQVFHVLLGDIVWHQWSSWFYVYLHFHIMPLQLRLTQKPSCVIQRIFKTTVLCQVALRCNKHGDRAFFLATSVEPESFYNYQTICCLVSWAAEEFHSKLNVFGPITLKKVCTNLSSAIPQTATKKRKKKFLVRAPLWTDRAHNSHHKM